MGSITRTVTVNDTAIAVGSGSVEVLGTPVLIAWLEAATVAALDLGPEQTSVGISVQVSHVLAGPVGATITAAAKITEKNERTVVFAVHAQDQAGRLVGEGQITRAIVTTERFIAKIPGVSD